MSMPLLTVTASQVESSGILALAGEIDLSTSHLLVDAIDAAIEALLPESSRPEPGAARSA